MRAANDNEPALRFLSVCSGIEAASVAFGPLGWEAVAFAEIEKFPSAVLAYRYPNVPNLGDFTTIDTSYLGRVDILCGGTPCQAFSVAGRRNSLADARGNLTLAFVDLAHALTDGNGLRNVVWENVPGVLSTKDNAFGCFLGALVGADDALVPTDPTPAEGKSGRWWRWSRKDGRHAVRWPRYGMVAGPKGRAAWAIKDAQFFGLAQRRERVLLVADFGNGADPFKVLFEPEGVCRDSAPSRKTQEDVAGTIAGGARKGGGYSTDDVPLTAGALDAAGGGVDENDAAQNRLVACLDASFGRLQGCSGQDVNHGHSHLVAVAFGGNNTSGPIDVATSVNAHGGPHGRLDFESETFVLRGISDYGDGTPSLGAKGGDAGGGSEALCVEGFDASEDGSGRGAPIIAFGAQNSASQGDSVSAHITPTLDKSKVPAVAFTVSEQSNGFGWESDIAPALEAHPQSDTSSRQKGVRVGSSVRRLTPVECERLQGFPDNYTDIPWRGKPTSPDGPRYKALGNSWAVPKFRWLGERIQRFMPANDNHGEASLAA